MEKKSKLNLILIIIIVAFIVLALSASLSGCTALGRLGSSTTASKSTTSGIETSAVKRGNIIQSISTTGTVDSSEIKNLSVQVSGEVLQTSTTGSHVKKGDILLKVDNTKLLLSIEQSKINVEVAESSLKQAQISYKAALDANHVAIQVAQKNNELAQQSSDNAYNNLENTNSIGNASIESATIALQNAQNSFNASINQAQVSLDQATNQLNIVKGNSPSDEKLASSEASVANAQASYNSSVTSATNSLNSASASLNQAQEQASSNSENAENSYKQALINQSIAYWNTLSSLEQAQQKIQSTIESINSAKKQVDLAKISLETASLDLNKNVIVAPFDGVILSSAFNQGEYSSSGATAISIASDDFLIKSSVNETDITKVSIGNNVNLSFDAYPEKEFQGEITSISEAPTVLNNITSYEIKVRLKNTDKLKLLYGLSTNLTIITAKAEKVLMIPVQAVYKENGKEFVDILLTPPANSKTTLNMKDISKSIKKIEITTGISNYTYVEVKSGLNEGDLVITSNLDTINQSNQSSQSNQNTTSVQDNTGNKDTQSNQSNTSNQGNQGSQNTSVTKGDQSKTNN